MPSSLLRKLPLRFEATQSRSAMKSSSSTAFAPLVRAGRGGSWMESCVTEREGSADRLGDDLLSPWLLLSGLPSVAPSRLSAAGSLRAISLLGAALGLAV